MKKTKRQKKSSTENLFKIEFVFHNFSSFFELKKYTQSFQEYLLDNILVRLRFGYLDTSKY